MDRLFDSTPENDLKLAHDLFIKKLGKDNYKSTFIESTGSEKKVLPLPQFIFVDRVMGGMYFVRLNCYLRPLD